MNPVFAATRWATNADLIESVVALGYLRPTDVVLDPTYGRGRWWSTWAPETLIRHDLVTLDGVDFRDLPEENDSVDVVAYDPPYVVVGGRHTSTLGASVPRGEGEPVSDFHDRYGLAEAPRTPRELQALINAGLAEAARVTRRYVLVRCQDYISSGKFWNGTYETQKFAIETLGLTQVDRLERIDSGRPQPQRPRQVHARRNISTLFVFEKKRARS